MIDLIAIDLDGTLLDSQKTISPKNKQAVQDAVEAGYQIVLCTGRPYLGMKNYVKELGLHQAEDNYIIVFNGGQIRRAQDGEILYSNQLSLADMQRWYAETEALDLPLNLVDNDWVYEPLAYPENYPSFYVTKMTTAPAKRVDYADFPADQEFIKFVMTVEEEHLAEQIPKISPELYETYAVVRSHPFQLEVMPKGVSKGQALKVLGERLNIPLDRMAGMGDQENDVAMLEAVGYSVVMGNASDKIKGMADYVTASNDEDGVAQAIYHIMEKE